MSQMMYLLFPNAPNVASPCVPETWLSPAPTARLRLRGSWHRLEPTRELLVCAQLSLGLRQTCVRLKPEVLHQVEVQFVLETLFKADGRQTYRTLISIF